MEYLNIFSALQIVFLFLILFFKNKNYLNKLLATIFLIPSISFVFNALDILNLLPTNIFGSMYFVVLSLMFLFAPLLFYYINLMCGEKLKFTNPIFIVTFIAFIYDFFGLIKFIFLTKTEKESYVLAIKLGDFPKEVLVISVIFFLIQQIYFTLSVVKIYKFKKKAVQVLSYRSNTKIKFTMRFVFIAWGANLISLWLYSFLPMRFVEFVMLPIILLVMVNFVFYYAFKFQVIFNEKTYTIFLKDLQLINSNSTYNIDLEKNLYAKEIESFLMKEKKYLNPNYTIFDLSKDLGFSQYEVSNVINKEIGVNFSKLINDYRVEEAKLILKEKIDNLTIEAIAKLAGFKSRASFYRAFKNKTGITPLEYVKS